MPYKEIENYCQYKAKIVGYPHLTYLLLSVSLYLCTKSMDGTLTISNRDYPHNVRKHCFPYMLHMH